MKIVLTSVGTRGDMEPFLAIGLILRAKGHHVICAFPEQFRNLVEEANLEFASLGSKLIELLDSDVGKAAMGGSSGTKKFLAILKLARTQKESQIELVNRQSEIFHREQPDRIVYNGKAVVPIFWEIKNPGTTTFVSPIPYMHYVKGHTHIAFNSNFGEFFNKLTFSLAHFGMVSTTLMAKKWLKIKDRISRKKIKDNLKYNKAIYTISPTLFARPDHWHKNLKVLGYHQAKRSENWIPDETLNTFINKHDKILFITFGSMVNSEPVKKTSIFLEILENNNIPAIINTASGGLIQAENYNKDLFHFVSRIPYEWIFPKVYGVIHHGGSGTTHLALKHACASTIIPHIIDQFVWNRIISDLGVGPKGIKINSITKSKLEPKLLDLFHNESYKENAEKLKVSMEKEDFEEELYQSIIE